MKIGDPRKRTENLGMESSSLNLHCRKRKKQRQSPSDLLVGIFTRSKSQVYVHRNRSGLARHDVPGKSHLYSIASKADSFPGKPTSIQTGPGKETGTEPLEVSLEVKDKITYRITSIKDLRARRVFSPAVVAILEEDKGKINEELKLLDYLDLPDDLDRIKDLNEGDKKVDEENQSGQMVSPEADLGENSSKNGVNLMKHETNSGNGSIPRSNTALNPCAKRKVFKTPSSFSYRRLIPYLMDIAKEESSVSRIEIVDGESPHKLTELCGLRPKMPLSMENDYAAKPECNGEQVNPTKLFENEEIKTSDKEQPCVLQNFGNVENKLQQEDHLNGANGIGGSGEYTEISNLLTEKPIIKGTSVPCMSTDNRSRHSPNGKSGTNRKTEALLAAGSQLRIFKARSSVSYRRLLPYLNAVAKQSSRASEVIQHPKPEADLEDKQPLSSATYDEENPVKKIRLQSFSKQPRSEDGEQALLPAIIPPVNDSSSNTNNNLSPSTPPLHSSNDSSKIGSNPLISVDTTNLTKPLDLPKEGKMLVQSNQKEFESEVPHNDTKVCDGKSNGSAVLSRESCSKLSEPQLVDTSVGCMSVSLLETHKAKKELIQKVTSDKSPSQIEVSVNLLDLTDGPFKGILKRNPIGCRGACNCLNCASFRLHAERAFEFSRRQMHEAEEIAWKLMNELAKVRYMLERSSVNENDLTTVQLNQVEVKEARNRALETENLAKERLNQLNYELNIHCRIPASQRPSVTFANHIQERIISKKGSSTVKKPFNKENS